MASSDFYPTPPLQSLKSHFIGKNIYTDIAGPAAIINRSIVRRNCDLLLSWISRLELDFRAHVKTHKTVELTRLQVGDLPNVNLVCSTVPEILHHVPLLKEYKAQGRTVSVIYGIPPSSTCFAQLETARNELGSDAVGFLLDHPSQIPNVASGNPETPTPVWVKVDSGQHRAGIVADGTAVDTLLQSLASEPGIQLQGIYSHNSTSYSANSRAQALDYLALEIHEAKKVADKARALGLLALRETPNTKKFTITVGASPSVTSIYHLDEDDAAAAATFKALLTDVKAEYTLELHAGVYPVLDVQQMDTHETTTDKTIPGVTSESVGVRILAEVLSVYTERERPEALIGAGCLALGREPAKSYPGFGLVTGRKWNTVMSSRELVKGWTVARISQEHGNLVWNGGEDIATASASATATASAMDKKEEELKIGDKVLLIPNHACIASAGFGWYLVVDGDDGETVEDVWVRCRGW